MDDNLINNDYILIKKLYDNKTISMILNKYYKEQNEILSRVGIGEGRRVAVNKKVRKDYIFTNSQSKNIDDLIFYKIQKIVKDNTNINLKYRENYKIGSYYGDDKGFYIPHTDIQGSSKNGNLGYSHRKISIVICLSQNNNYEGGIFNFVDLKKKFKFDIGDTMIFRSELLHGVEPVTNGVRQVLISFMWDEDNEQIRQNNWPIVNKLKYLPNEKQSIN